MFGVLQGKKVLLCVTGGIACYKAVVLLRLFQKSGADVTVAATPAALRFVGIATWESLSKRKVLTDVFDIVDSAKIAHISFAQESDVIVVAPATGNTVAKAAHGVADTVVTALLLAASAPIVIAPSMNSVMYINSATQNNLSVLSSRGYTVLPAGDGELACNDSGIGRMAEPEYILEATAQRCATNEKNAKHQRWLVTAGATKEYLDPIRFLTNGSSGLTGLLIAEYAALTGSDVTLIAGSLPRKPRFGVQIHTVSSAADMDHAVEKHADSVDVFVMSAAVSDYTTDKASSKIKKQEQPLTLSLHRTTDILKRSADYMSSDIIRVGFAAETDNIEINALKKMSDKSLDMICANTVSEAHNPFGANSNEMILFTPSTKRIVPMTTKEQLAIEIVEETRRIAQEKKKQK